MADVAASTGLGEDPGGLERMIVSPALGTFRPEPGDATAEGAWLEAGQAIGKIESLGRVEVVRTPFSGYLMGMTATNGERVRVGQPIAWLRSAG
jgi:biotin carboxyl carrier protein